jgi:hypothetical protein
MELWSLFAKYGRVGEIYIPKKRDRKGNRFGFVKFKEVKSVEALGDRLVDVWLGSFKLHVNLSRFGRKRRSVSPGNKTTGSNSHKGTCAHSSPAAGGGGHSTEKSFISALLGGPQEQGCKTLVSLEAEVDTEFFSVLEGSYVGRLMKGVEVRAVQVKLWLAGLNSVRASAMGGGLVLLFCNSGENIGDPARDIEWWGGLLSELKTWSPNLVYSRRELWVSMYGIPIHAWGEATF